MASNNQQKKQEQKKDTVEAVKTETAVEAAAVVVQDEQVSEGIAGAIVDVAAPVVPVIAELPVVQVVAAPVPAPVAKIVVSPIPQGKTKALNFAEKIADLKVNGSEREKALITYLEAYTTKMAPGVPLTIKESVANQQSLWRALFNLIQNEDNFNEGFNLVLSYFREFKDAAFHEKYVFRDSEHFTIGADQIFTFLALLNLLKIAAGSNSHKLVLKQVDMNRTLTAVYSDEGRQRVLNYFNA